MRLFKFHYMYNYLSTSLIKFPIFRFLYFIFFQFFFSIVSRKFKFKLTPNFHSALPLAF
jgi:hypothetical protein